MTQTRGLAGGGSTSGNSGRPTEGHGAPQNVKAAPETEILRGELDGGNLGDEIKNR